MKKKDEEHEDSPEILTFFFASFQYEIPIKHDSVGFCFQKSSLIGFHLKNWCKKEVSISGEDEEERKQRTSSFSFIFFLYLFSSSFFFVFFLHLFSSSFFVIFFLHLFSSSFFMELIVFLFFFGGWVWGRGWGLLYRRVHCGSHRHYSITTTQMSQG